MPETLNPLALTELLKDQGYPCLSLFQPTHLHYPENQQDPIRSKNLCKALEAVWAKDYPELDSNTGEVILDPQSFGGDVLDDLSEAVMTMGGTVSVVSADTMPSATGLAATFRF